MQQLNRKNSKFRRTSGARIPAGAATVELAVVLPVLVVCTLAMIDVSQFAAAQQIVNRASMAGARRAADAASNDVREVEVEVETQLQEDYPHLSTAELQENLEVQVSRGTGQTLAGSELASVESGEPLAVSVKLNYDAVRLLKGLPGLDSRVVETVTVIRRE